MSRKNISPLCNEPGCTEPRMVGSKGRQHPKCETHMREYWRKKTAERVANNHKSEDKPPAKREPKPKAESTSYQHQQMQARIAQRNAHAAEDLTEIERCPTCHRTPEQAATWATRGVICHTCAHRLPQDVPPKTEIKVVHVNMRDNRLDILKSRRVRSLDMPDTEGALNRMIEVYEKSGYVIAK